MSKAFPKGWDEERVRQVLAHYENQSEDEQFAEIEAALEQEDTVMMAVPAKLAPEVIPLPITLPDTALGIECEDKIRDALQADPKRLRSRKAVAFAVEEAAEGGDHAHHRVE